VREAFAQHKPAELTRTCAFCGVEATTHFEHCPACGRSYFERPPRLSRAVRRGLIAVGAVAVAAFAVWLTPQLVDFRHHSDERARASHARLLVAERARLIAEQRPHRGSAVSLRPAAGASSATQLRARRRLLGRAESSILADARSRVGRGLLSGTPPTTARCGALVRNQVKGDEEDLTKTVGRYSCVAVQGNAVQQGQHVGLLGIPFVAAVDFRRFTYVWCKDNPAANAASHNLVFVRLSRACLASRGKAFGTGYLESP
jgi:hypothetical protein